MKIRLIIEPRDFWVGVFWDTGKRRLYILPVPCIGIMIQY